MLTGAVLFFLPTYLTQDFLIGFLSYATAHGLQYVAILGFHSLNIDQGQERFIPRHRALIIFTFGGLAAYFLYAGSGFSNVVAAGSHLTDSVLHYAISHETQTRFVVAFIVATSAAHCWFDQNIWRFREPERRKWLLERYPFLGPPSWPAADGYRVEALKNEYREVPSTVPAPHVTQ